MYILFALVVSLVLYGLLAVVLHTARAAASGSRSTALWSALFLVAGLVLFNLASRAVGVDPGPFHAVSYNIPEDYRARGLVGLLALIPYAVACLSPVVALGVSGIRRGA